MGVSRTAVPIKTSGQRPLSPQSVSDAPSITPEQVRRGGYTTSMTRHVARASVVPTTRNVNMSGKPHFPHWRLVARSHANAPLQRDRRKLGQSAWINTVLCLTCQGRYTAQQLGRKRTPLSVHRSCQRCSIFTPFWYGRWLRVTKASNMNCASRKDC